jgi:hypothetical protein
LKKEIRVSTSFATEKSGRVHVLGAGLRINSLFGGKIDEIFTTLLGADSTRPKTKYVLFC